jgi:hypothetical protein
MMGILHAIAQGDFEEFDNLPFTAKLILLSRLSDNMGREMADLRDRLYHNFTTPSPIEPEVPRLAPPIRQRHSAIPDQP